MLLAIQCAGNRVLSLKNDEDWTSEFETQFGVDAELTSQIKGQILVSGMDNGFIESGLGTWGLCFVAIGETRRVLLPFAKPLMIPTLKLVLLQALGKLVSSSSKLPTIDEIVNETLTMFRPPDADQYLPAWWDVLEASDFHDVLSNIQDIELRDWFGQGLQLLESLSGQLDDEHDEILAAKRLINQPAVYNRKSPTSYDLAVLLARLAQRAIGSSKGELARVCAHKSKTLLDERWSSLTQGICLLQARIWLSMNRPRDALVCTDEIHAIDADVDPSMSARSHRVAASAHFGLREYGDAVKQAVDAVKWSSKGRVASLDTGHALLIHAGSLHAAGDYASALQPTLFAAEVFSLLGKHNERDMAMGNAIALRKKLIVAYSVTATALLNAGERDLAFSLQNGLFSALISLARSKPKAAAGVLPHATAMMEHLRVFHSLHPEDPIFERVSNHTPILGRIEAFVEEPSSSKELLEEAATILSRITDVNVDTIIVFHQDGALLYHGESKRAEESRTEAHAFLGELLSGALSAISSLMEEAVGKKSILQFVDLGRAKLSMETGEHVRMAVMSDYHNPSLRQGMLDALSELEVKFGTSWSSEGLYHSALEGVHESLVAHLGQFLAEDFNQRV